MLISMNWISDFVDLSGLDIEGLIHRFTLSTAEVEDIFHKGEDVKGVVAGKILTIKNHPNSKKLHLLTVDVGKEVLNIVCGAPNVREGMVVPVATVGGKAGGMDISARPVAGYDSFGMCCSESELGISADHSGLMELPEDTVLGTDIKKLFGVEDIIFEVDNKSLTNRPDLWGHYGIAREFAALAGRPLKPMELHDLDQYKKLPEVSIDVIDKEHCFRYSSVKVENVSVAVSPVDMRIRLFYCGMRAINLLADLTNYLMLEMGQPMHAFDLRKVDRIEVRRFDKPFEFETLDQTTRKIDEDTLMICSGGKPVAVAGIMGGYDSEIADDTSSLLIESANFDGVSVRKSTVRLGLRTDASMRYEKMLDPEMTVQAIGRYLWHLFNICPDAKVISRVSDCYVRHYDSVTLDFDMKYVDRYTGIKITKARIIKTLTSLGFVVRSDRNNFSVDVPSWRATKDVTIKADIIEEITRIYGYDNFEIKTTLSPLKPVRATVGANDSRLIKDTLSGRFAMHEVHSYIWNDAKKLRELGIELEENTKLINSINPDQVVLRRSIIPTLLVAAAENRSFSDRFGIYEIGRVADGLLDSGKCNERRRLGIVLFSRTQSEKELFMQMKDTLLDMLSSIKNIMPVLSHAEKAVHSWQHPVNSVTVTLAGHEIGSMYTVMPSVSAAIDRKAAVICAEIDVDELSLIVPEAPASEEVSKFPGVDIDLSLLCDKALPYASVCSAVEGYECDILKGCSLVDIYENESLAGKKVITVRLSFSSPERTLSGDEVSEKTAEIVTLLDKAGMPLRK